MRVFQPLLLEECAAQMLRGQEEGQVLSSQVGAGSRRSQAFASGGDHQRPHVRWEGRGLWRAHVRTNTTRTATQAAVVAACTPSDGGESLAVRLTVGAEVVGAFHDNDMVLVCRQKPDVRHTLHSCACLPLAVLMGCTALRC